eukprot:1197816-Amphidinium_carterae.2
MLHNAQTSGGLGGRHATHQGTGCLVLQGMVDEGAIHHDMVRFLDTDREQPPTTLRCRSPRHLDAIVDAVEAHDFAMMFVPAANSVTRLVLRCQHSENRTH